MLGGWKGDDAKRKRLGKMMLTTRGGRDDAVGEEKRCSTECKAEGGGRREVVVEGSRGEEAVSATEMGRPARAPS